MPAELEFIAEKDGFTLFNLKDRSTLEWRNLKLVRKGKAPKNNWWLAWNGERFAVNHDEGKLAEHHPEIRGWVIQVLKS